MEFLKTLRCRSSTGRLPCWTNGNFTGFFLVFVLLILQLCPTFIQAETGNLSPLAKDGLLDLRANNFFEKKSTELNGAWLFYPGETFTRKKKGRAVSVPGTWKKECPDTEVGYYYLKIFLPKNRPRLSIVLADISCAHNLWINGQLCSGTGFCGSAKETTIPHLKHRVLPLPTNADTIELKIQVAGFYDAAPGILSAIKMGDAEYLERYFFNEQVAGATLIGVLLLLTVMHLGFRKVKAYHTFFAIAIFLYGFHLCFMNHRWAFNLLGPGSWSLNLRLELFSLQAFFMFGLLSIEQLLRVQLHKILRFIIFLVFACTLAFVLFAPIKASLIFIQIIPYFIISSMVISISLSLIAKRRKTEYALPVLICNCILVAGAIVDRFTFDLHVDHLIPAHYSMSAYVIFLSFLMLHQTNQAFRKVNALSQNLKNLNAELEKQNQNLEETVKIRTEELTAEQKRTYELELENKKRDMEAISANNKLKQDVSRSIILDLEKIARGKKDVQLAIKQFILQLKQQFALDEKLNTLQSNTNKVNSEFYERLVQRFPDLTKQEKELCSLIRLNLSNKDMGILLKTSSNAINVARSRLRKKLGLNHEDDMDVFIQKI